MTPRSAQGLTRVTQQDSEPTRKRGSLAKTGQAEHRGNNNSDKLKHTKHVNTHEFIVIYFFQEESLIAHFLRMLLAYNSLFWKAVSEGKEPSSCCLSLISCGYQDSGRYSHYRSTPGEKRRKETQSVTASQSQWSDGHRDDQHRCWHHKEKDEQRTHACCHLGSIPAPELNLDLPVQGRGGEGDRRAGYTPLWVAISQVQIPETPHITDSPDLFYECILQRKK